MYVCHYLAYVLTYYSSTLYCRLALKIDSGSVPKLCSQAWLCFVQYVDISAIKSMLSYIVVTLLPLLRVVPVDVAEVFKYLVITCR